MSAHRAGSGSAGIDMTFLVAAGERAVRVFASSMVGLIGANQLVTAIDWGTMFSASGMAVVVDVLTSLAGKSSLVPGDGPSLVPVEQVATAATETVSEAVQDLEDVGTDEASQAAATIEQASSPDELAAALAKVQELLAQQGGTSG